MFNMVAIGVPFSALVAKLQLYSGCSSRPDRLPSALVFVRDLLVMAVCEEAAFYYSHRLVKINVHSM